GGGHFRFQGGDVLVARLAQARGEIDQARAHDEPGCIDLAVRPKAVGPAAQGDDAAFGNVDVLQRVQPAGRIDHAAAMDVDTHAQLLATIDMTAMRTAIPNVTCGRITDWRPSATLESISMPRFIGPGCSTMASGLARASFSGVRP